MNRILQFSLLLVVYCFSWLPVFAGSHTLHYKLTPGQVWICTLSAQNESTFLGKKNVSRSKSVIEYRVSRGPRSGWVSLTARIKSQSNQSGGQIDPSRILFKADMHRSGEIRTIQYSGSAVLPMGEGADQLPPEAAAALEQSSRLIAEAWKNAVFWFPEIPEEPLEPGDEFEATQKLSMGGGGSGIQVETVSKQVFTLEDVSGGLAYFSVKERSLTETSGAVGGKTKTKTAGKGEAIFDLRQGMWIEMTTKTRSHVHMGSLPGTSGGGSQDTYTISKVRMEKR
jgi:hypothetical protein